MRTLALLAATLVAACSATNAHDEVDPVAAESEVTSPGGAMFRGWIQSTTELPDGSMLVIEGRSDESRRFSKLTPDFARDPQFKQRQLVSGDISTTLLPIDGGARFVTITRAGRVDVFSAISGDNEKFFELPLQAGSGVQNLDAVVTPDGSVTLLLAEQRRRVYVTASSFVDYGLSEIVIASLDLATKSVIRQLPIPLPHSTEPNGVRVIAFRALGDGSFAVVVEVLRRAPNDPTTSSHYFLVRSANGHAEPPAELLVSPARTANFAGLGEGRDGTLTAAFTPGLAPPPELDGKIVAVSVSKTGIVAPKVVVGPAAASPCGDVGFVGDQLVAVQSATATTKDGTGEPSPVGIEVRRFSSSEPVTTETTPDPNWCVKRLFPQPSGNVFVWASDTRLTLSDKQRLFRIE